MIIHCTLIIVSIRYAEYLTLLPLGKETRRRHFSIFGEPKTQVQESKLERNIHLITLSDQLSRYSPSRK